MIKKKIKYNTVITLYYLISFFLLVNGVAAHAIDYDFYNRNDIVFYGSNSICSTGQGEGTVTLVGDDNLEKILRYYVGKGLTLKQAAGIAGNYQQESGFNPAIRQGGAIAGENFTPINGEGFGIAQWTFSGRQQPLVNLSKSTNRTIIDLSLQLDYSWKELEENPGYGLEQLKEASSPEDAAYIFHKYYEVSADSEAAVKKTRGGNAKTIYNLFSSSIPDGSSDNSSGSEVCTGSGAASAFTSDDFTIYNQCDPQWGEQAFGSSKVCPSGCGPSAMAMIITALNGKSITPKDTIKIANDNNIYINGVGSSWNVTPVLAKEWGLQSSRIKSPSVASVNEALRSGGLIITSGSGPSPYTTGGHYIVIRGVTESGKWKIGDSNGQKGIENSDKEWDPETILNNTALENVWVISK